MIYGRRHRIVECDPFTKSFLTQQGVDVPLPEPEPTDMFTEHRNKVNKTLYCIDLSVIGSITINKNLLLY